MGHEDISNRLPSPEDGPSSSADPVSGQGASPSVSPSGIPDVTGRAGLTRQQCGECLLAVAHRLSQPLTALRGALELALTGPVDAGECRAALEQAFELTGQFVQLLSSLRDLGEAAAPGAASGCVSLSALAKEAQEELRGFAQARGVGMLLAASPEVTVSGPPERLRELVLKLLWLAIKRSPRQMELPIVVSAANGSAALVLTHPFASIRPDEFDLPPVGATDGLGRLFAEAAKTHRLDWAILNTLVESLGGSLQVTSQKPQGYSIILRLPLASDQKP